MFDLPLFYKNHYCLYFIVLINVEFSASEQIR